MAVGERLRRARLERGLSLEQVSRQTKVQPWILDAIERDDLSRIPGGVFIRGYLTSFARAIGLDPIDVVTAHFGASPTPTDVEPPPPVVEQPRPTGTPLWQMAVIVAAAIAVGLIWRNAARQSSDVAVARAPIAAAAKSTVPAIRQTEPLAPVPAATAGVVAPTPTAAVGSDRAPDSAGIAGGNSPLVVELHTTGDAWIEATVDGERKAYRLFSEGETLRLDGQKEIRLLVGDASAVTYTVNGKPAPSLGGAGIVRSVVISDEGVRAPTASRPIAADTRRGGAQGDVAVSSPPSTIAPEATIEPSASDPPAAEKPASDGDAQGPAR